MILKKKLFVHIDHGNEDILKMDNKDTIKMQLLLADVDAPRGIQKYLRATLFSDCHRGNLKGNLERYQQPY